MNNKDLDIFKNEVSWFFNPSDIIELTASQLGFSDNFISTFPKLHKLVSQATVLGFAMARKNKIAHYIIFSWTGTDNLKSGWLCKFETNTNNIEILYEHQLLLENIGGIQESYTQINIEEEMLTDNQNFLFIKSECTKGLGDWTELYDQVCEDENAKQIDPKNLVCFAGEANGNETFYNLNTKQVLVFASDHCFENVEVLKGQPEFTFYTINGITTFVDYAETLAQQWLDNIAT